MIIIYRIILQLFLILTFSCYTLAQTKTYNGPYKGDNVLGIAVYNYFEKDDIRVYNGSFHFVSTDKTLVINGKYRNNFKNDLWTYTFSFAKAGFRSGTMSGKFTCNFVDGNLNGVGSFYRKTNILSSGGGFIEDTSNALFNNNTFSGSFYYKSNLSLSDSFFGKNILLNGQFNSNGLCNGKWTLKYENSDSNIKYERTYLFCNGLLIRVSELNTSTGEIDVITDNSDKQDLINNFNKIYNDSLNEAIIGDKVYYLIRYSNDMESIERERLILQSQDGGIIFGKDSELIDILSIWYDRKQFNDICYLGEIDKGWKGFQLPIVNIAVHREKTYNLSK